jgi:DNA-binding NtrC family response regulator
MSHSCPIAKTLGRADFCPQLDSSSPLLLQGLKVSELPLIVSLLSDPNAINALGNIQAELFSVSSRDQMLAGKFPRSPRLFLIEAAKGDAEQTKQTVVTLRREQPLTDVLLWSPQATGVAVRTFFHAGAKDVIVSRSIERLLESISVILDDQQILPRLNELTRQRSRTARFESLLSRSESMWDLFELCTRIAHADATVLIAGETGTGKELLARAVHRRSGRKGRFVAANCASIPPELVNSALFGHDKGAFTGADRAKVGLVTHANGGTLFLDEIGDMPPEGQLSLLRLLQEKLVRPVGSLNEVEVNVRVVAATNVTLHEAVRAGNFREDLFYRLDVIRMNIPALRERPEDILFLFGHFAKRLAKHYGLEPPTWSDGFLDALVAYQWPGNVRQLENFSERLILSRPQKALTVRDFNRLRDTRLSDPNITNVGHGNLGRRTEIDTSKPLRKHLESIVKTAECEYLKSVLADNKGRVIDAAKQAGISRRTLLRKMNLYEINKQDFKG